MKRGWKILGLVLAFLPMLIAIWVFGAAQWSVFDASTAWAPDPLPAMVAGLVLNRAGFGEKGRPAVERAVRVNPVNGPAWTRLCSMDVIDETYPAEKAMSECVEANRFQHSSGSEFRLGQVYERQDRECDAQQQFESALRTGGAMNSDYSMLQALGRATLRCGKELYAAKSELMNATEMIEKDLQSPDDYADEDDLAFERKELLEDRKYLSAALGLLHEQGEAQATCLKVDAKWKTCGCLMDVKGKVSCEGT